MKKIITVSLAVIMLLSLVLLAGCADPATNPTDTTPDNTPIDTPADTPANNFVVVNETVYATTAVNVRSSMSTENNDNVKGQLKAGDTIVRIGYTEEWSKVLFDGVECFVKSEYLAKEPPVIDTPANTEDFTPVANETVYVYSDQDDDGKCDGRCDEEGQNKVTVNLYPAPVRENMKYALECGTELVRTGVLIEDVEKGYGWSQVIYNGETLYIRNSCVTTVKPHDGATTGTTPAETTPAETPAETTAA